MLRCLLTSVFCLLPYPFGYGLVLVPAGCSARSRSGWIRASICWCRRPGRPGPGRLHPAIAHQEVGRVRHDEFRGHLRPFARACHRVRAVRRSGGPGVERAVSTLIPDRTRANRPRHPIRDRPAAHRPHASESGRQCSPVSKSWVGWSTDNRRPTTRKCSWRSRADPTPTGRCIASPRWPRRVCPWQAGWGWSSPLSPPRAESLWDSLLRHPEWLDRPADR